METLVPIGLALMLYGTLGFAAISVRPAWLEWRIFPTRLESGSRVHRLELGCYAYMAFVWGLMGVSQAFELVPREVSKPLMFSTLAAVLIGGIAGMRDESNES